MAVQFHQIITHFLTTLHNPKCFFVFAVDFPNYWHTSRKTPSPSLRNKITFINIDFRHFIDYLTLGCNFYDHFVGLANDTILVLNVTPTENHLFVKFTKEAYWRAFIKRLPTIYVLFHSQGKIIFFFPQFYSV